MRRDPARLLPLSPQVLHILLALVDGDRHGYGIMQEVEALTGGKVRLGPGTLYGAIRRLREEGLIEEQRSRHDRRRNYRLTSFGRKVTRLEVERLEALYAAARAKLVGLTGRSA
jgi:DNA-binding PadR family transcriptional regulator